MKNVPIVPEALTNPRKFIAVFFVVDIIHPDNWVLYGLFPPIKNNMVQI
jgi:hypothetical protein